MSIPKVAPNILISPDQQDKYLSSNQIRYKTLSNGIKIIGASRNTNDSYATSVIFSFQTGAYFDPKGKEGLHHLVEHFINYPIRDLAKKYGVQLNAGTGSFTVREECQGPANGHITDFGIFPIIKEVYSRFQNLTGVYNDFENRLLAEKKVILTEINDDFAHHNFHVFQEIGKHILAKSNPYRIYIPGTENSLNSITSTDVTILAAKIFAPENMIITINTNSTDENCRLVVDQIAAIFEKMPKSKFTSPTIDWGIGDLTDPGYQPGMEIRHNTGLKNNVITLGYLWPIEFPALSSEKSSIGNLADWLNQKIFTVSREKGWGYSTFFGRTLNEFTTGTIYLFTDIPKTDSNKIAKLHEEMKTTCFEIFQKTKPDAEEIITLQKKWNEVSPWTKSSLLDWSVRGLRVFNQFINTEELDRISVDYPPKLITDWLDKLLSTTPASVIIGDLPS